MKRSQTFLWGLLGVVAIALALSGVAMAGGQGDLLSEITGGQLTTDQAVNLQTKGGQITTPGHRGGASATGGGDSSGIPDVCHQGDPNCLSQDVINNSSFGGASNSPNSHVITGGVGAPGSNGPLHINNGFGDGTGCATGCTTPSGVLVGNGLGGDTIGTDQHNDASSFGGVPTMLESDTLINQNIEAGNFDAAERLISDNVSFVDGAPVEFCGNC